MQEELKIEDSQAQGMGSRRKYAEIYWNLIYKDLWLAESQDLPE